MIPMDPLPLRPEEAEAAAAEMKIVLCDVHGARRPGTREQGSAAPAISPEAQWRWKLDARRPREWPIDGAERVDAEVLSRVEAETHPRGAGPCPDLWREMDFWLERTHKNDS